jgi:hypothetical protein
VLVEREVKWTGFALEATIQGDALLFIHFAKPAVTSYSDTADSTAQRDHSLDYDPGGGEKVVVSDAGRIRTATHTHTHTHIHV